MNELLGFLGVIAGGLITFLGVRYMAKSGAKIDQARIDMENRKVDQTAFKQLEDSMNDQFQTINSRLSKTERWLRVSLGHIIDIRTDVRLGRPLSPFPPELREIPFTYFPDSPPASSNGNREEGST